MNERHRSFRFTRRGVQDEEQLAKLPLFLIRSPMVFGCLGLFLSAAYEAQRDGVFNLFPALNHYIQHHLDAIAGGSLLCGIMGILSGIVILRQSDSRRRMIKNGILISVLSLIWSTAFLSL